MDSLSLNCGNQPLDSLMEQWQLSNHTLVATSTEQLTHKQVQKARKGRRLTLKMMQKITRAFNVAIWQTILSDKDKEVFEEYPHSALFSYAKGYKEANPPLNIHLIEAHQSNL